MVYYYGDDNTALGSVYQTFNQKENVIKRWTQHSDVGFYNKYFDEFYREYFVEFYREYFVSIYNKYFDEFYREYFDEFYR